MVQSTKVDDSLCVTAQVTPDQCAQVAAAGFRTLINNRPDGEEPGQPSAAALGEAAAAAGLDYRHLPLSPGALNDELVKGFAAALDDCPGPALAFCRSGRRSYILWALSRGDKTPEAVRRMIGDAAERGFDIALAAQALGVVLD